MQNRLDALLKQIAHDSKYSDCGPAVFVAIIEINQFHSVNAQTDVLLTLFCSVDA